MSNETAIAKENPAMPHICVCLCTYRRRELLRRLLARLGKLKGDGEAFTLSCVVVDNDAQRSAADVVAAARAATNLEIVYDCEPERNFAAVRNRAVKISRGDFIAFIDDDEVPVNASGWWNFWRPVAIYECSGVLGPVRPYFDDPSPRWLVKSKICDRPEHPTGMSLNWDQTRSGNRLTAAPHDF